MTKDLIRERDHLHHELAELREIKRGINPKLSTWQKADARMQEIGVRLSAIGAQLKAQHVS